MGKDWHTLFSEMQNEKYTIVTLFLSLSYNEKKKEKNTNKYKNLHANFCSLVGLVSFPIKLIANANFSMNFQDAGRDFEHRNPQQ